MLDPTALFRLETDTSLEQARAGVLVVALEGFLDAGRAGHLVAQHLLSAHESTVVATFDIDQLLDYRGRRPVMTFSQDRWLTYDDPSLTLHRIVDASGTPFLLLVGPEPDYQWERMVAAMQTLIRLLGVTLTVSVHGIPMAVPHTRPIGWTGHATRSELIPTNDPEFGGVQIPGSLAGLLELRLGEAGKDALGYAVHVPNYLAAGEYGDAAVVALERLTGATGLDLDSTGLVAMAGVRRAEIAREIEGNDDVTELIDALERQYDTFMEGRSRPNLLVQESGDLPTADELGAEFEAFLKDVSEE